MDAPWIGRPSEMLLVDDDPHSARLLMRMLLAHGAPLIRWVDNPAAAAADIDAVLADTSESAHSPRFVIVDLKSSSTATRDFIAEIRRLERSYELTLVAMAPTLDREIRSALLDAGAEAVFERQAELAAYRREAASIVAFWVRTQRLGALGS